MTAAHAAPLELLGRPRYRRELPRGYGRHRATRRTARAALLELRARVR